MVLIRMKVGKKNEKKEETFAILPVYSYRLVNVSIIPEIYSSTYYDRVKKKARAAAPMHIRCLSYSSRLQ